MSTITKFLLKRDIKKIKRDTRDKIQVLYDLEELCKKIYLVGELSHEYFYYFWEADINIKEIVELKEKYKYKLPPLIILQITVKEIITHRKIKLGINNIKKLVSTIHNSFDKNQTKKIIIDIHNLISCNLEKIKYYEKEINRLKNINKLKKIAVEDLKEEYYAEWHETEDDLLNDTDYDGNKYDEEIVKDWFKNNPKENFMKELEDAYGKPWNEILEKRIDYFKKERPKEIKAEVDRLNIDRIKKYSPLFGYDIK